MATDDKIIDAKLRGLDAIIQKPVRIKAAKETPTHGVFRKKSARLMSQIKDDSAQLKQADAIVSQAFGNASISSNQRISTRANSRVGDVIPGGTIRTNIPISKPSDKTSSTDQLRPRVELNATLDSGIGPALSSQESILSRMEQFQAGPVKAYMAKDLALNYQQVILAKDTLTLLRSFSDLVEAKLDAIKVNTGVPEKEKETLLQGAMHFAFKEVVHGGITSLVGPYKKMLERISQEKIVNPIAGHAGRILKGTKLGKKFDDWSKWATSFEDAEAARPTVGPDGVIRWGFQKGTQQGPSSPISPGGPSSVQHPHVNPSKGKIIFPSDFGKHHNKPSDVVSEDTVRDMVRTAIDETIYNALGAKAAGHTNAAIDKAEKAASAVQKRAASLASKVQPKISDAFNTGIAAIGFAGSSIGKGGFSLPELKERFLNAIRNNPNISVAEMDKLFNNIKSKVPSHIKGWADILDHGEFSVSRTGSPVASPAAALTRHATNARATVRDLIDNRATHIDNTTNAINTHINDAVNSPTAKALGDTIKSNYDKLADMLKTLNDKHGVQAHPQAAIQESGSTTTAVDKLHDSFNAWVEKYEKNTHDQFELLKNLQSGEGFGGSGGSGGHRPYFKNTWWGHTQSAIYSTSRAVSGIAKFGGKTISVPLGISASLASKTIGASASVAKHTASLIFSKGRVPFVDIYRKDQPDKPLVTKRQFENGLMYMNFKPVIDVSDIYRNGPVFDPVTGNQVISEADLAAGLVDPHGRAITKLGGGKSLGGAVFGLGSLGIRTAASVGLKIAGMHFAFSKAVLGTASSLLFSKGHTPFVDVYRKDRKGNPLVRAKQFHEGLVFEDRKPVINVNAINRPVIDPTTGNILISQDDIDAGLVDPYGKDISKHKSTVGLASAGLRVGMYGIKSAAGVAKSIIGAANPALAMYGQLFGLGTKVVGHAAKLGSGLLGNLFGMNGIGKKDVKELITKRLDDIYKLLDERLVGANGMPNTSSVRANSYAAQTATHGISSTAGSGGTAGLFGLGAATGSSSGHQPPDPNAPSHSILQTLGEYGEEAGGLAMLKGVLQKIPGLRWLGKIPGISKITKGTLRGIGTAGKFIAKPGLALGAAGLGALGLNAVRSYGSTGPIASTATAPISHAIAPIATDTAKTASETIAPLATDTAKILAKEEAEKLATKEAEKIGVKAAAKGLGKTAAKTLIKKIPIIGALAGAGFAVGRLIDGDLLGAGGELASGLVGTLPGLGTAASVGIDGWLAVRDYENSTQVSKMVDARLKAYGAPSDSVDAVTDLESKCYKQCFVGRTPFTADDYSSAAVAFGFDSTDAAQMTYFKSWVDGRFAKIFALYALILATFGHVEYGSEARLSDKETDDIVDKFNKQSTDMVNSSSHLIPTLIAYNRVAQSIKNSLSNKVAPKIEPSPNEKNNLAKAGLSAAATASDSWKTAPEMLPGAVDMRTVPTSWEYQGGGSINVPPPRIDNVGNVATTPPGLETPVIPTAMPTATSPSAMRAAAAAAVPGSDVPTTTSAAGAIKQMQIAPSATSAPQGSSQSGHPVHNVAPIPAGTSPSAIIASNAQSSPTTGPAPPITEFVQPQTDATGPSGPSPTNVVPFPGAKPGTPMPTVTSPSGIAINAGSAQATAPGPTGAGPQMPTPANDTGKPTTPAATITTPTAPATSPGPAVAKNAANAATPATPSGPAKAAALLPTKPSKDAPQLPPGQIRYGSGKNETADASTINAITSAAAKTGVSPAALLAIAHNESGFNPNAGASTSNATGLFQFLNGTWMGQFAKSGGDVAPELFNKLPRDKHGNVLIDKIPADLKQQILALKKDPVAGSIMGAHLYKDTQEQLSKALGRPTSVGDNYMGHFLGVGGATKFLRDMDKNPNGIPHDPGANDTIFYKSVKGPDGKMHVDKTQPRTNKEVYDLMTSRVNENVGNKLLGAVNDALPKDDKLKPDTTPTKDSTPIQPSLADKVPTPPGATPSTDASGSASATPATTTPSTDALATSPQAAAAQSALLQSLEAAKPDNTGADATTTPQTGTPGTPSSSPILPQGMPTASSSSSGSSPQYTPATSVTAPLPLSPSTVPPPPTIPSTILPPVQPQDLTTALVPHITNMAEMLSSMSKVVHSAFGKDGHMNKLLANNLEKPSHVVHAPTTNIVPPKPESQDNKSGVGIDVHKKRHPRYRA